MRTVNRHSALQAWCLALAGLCGCHKAADPAAAMKDKPVPVAIGTVEQRDMPVYLEGLGTVTAFYTVTLKSQVDGRIDKVLFKEGQDVKRGDLLVLIDPRLFEIQLHQAEAALARDAAQLKNDRLNLERNKILLSKKLISQQTLDDQQALTDQYEGTVMSDQTQVDNAKLQLAYAHITSPIDGRTGVRLVDPGNLVHANDANGLVVITQLDPIAVLFTLPEDDLPRVSKQLAAGPLKVDAFSRDGTLNLGSGQVTLIDNEINTTSGTMRLKAVFQNGEHQLWPNQFVKARLLLTVRKGAIVVATTAIQRGPKGTFVYVLNRDKSVSVRDVKVQSIEGDSAVMESGLTPGEEVVTDGQYLIHEGSKVTPRELPPQNANAQQANDASPPQGSKDPNAQTTPPENGTPKDASANANQLPSDGGAKDSNKAAAP